jgi:hypothetical protein
MKKSPKHYEEIKNYVLNRYQCDGPNYRYVTIKQVVEVLGVTEGEAQQSFHLLNLEGVLGQATDRGLCKMYTRKEIYPLRKQNTRRSNGNH